MKFSVILTVEVERTSIPLLTRLSWRRRKAQVRERDKATCRYCGDHAPNGQTDHILPLSHGGNDNLENLAWACPGCNQSKGDRTLQEWAGTIALSPVPQENVEAIEKADPQLEQRIRSLRSEGLGLCEISDKVFGYHNVRKTAEVRAILGLS